jgi:hypothetical protein
MDLTLEKIDNMSVKECEDILAEWPRTPSGEFKGTRRDKVLAAKVFALRGTIAHQGKYSYSKVEYKNKDTKVLITCPEHGDFLQVPNSHVRGHGCSKCGDLATSEAKNYSTDSFIELAKGTHGSTYDYTQVQYVNSTTKVAIVCKEHGTFMQQPAEHLRGSGCSSCHNTTDVLYFWRIEGTDTYKLGVTGVTRLASRVQRVAAAHNIEAKILLAINLGHSKATALERQLHKKLRGHGYQSELITCGDGHTEFFDLPDSVVSELIREIESYDSK